MIDVRVRRENQLAGARIPVDQGTPWRPPRYPRELLGR